MGATSTARAERTWSYSQRRPRDHSPHRLSAHSCLFESTAARRRDLGLLQQGRRRVAAGERELRVQSFAQGADLLGGAFAQQGYQRSLLGCEDYSIIDLCVTIRTYAVGASVGVREPTAPANLLFRPAGAALPPTPGGKGCIWR